MRYLLDTHTLLWFLEKDNRLSVDAAREIKKIDNDIYVSVVSFWEITIKSSLGKLKTKANVRDMWQEVLRIQINILPVELTHLESLHHLPFHHGDPFDRTIISQAQAESLIIITKDQQFSKYSIQTLW